MASMIIRRWVLSILLVGVVMASAPRSESHPAGEDPAAELPEPGPARLELDARACARLVAHQPRDDVAYRPGVDVRGRKVVGADLENYDAFRPKAVSIPITMDFFARAGITPPAGLGAEAVVGRITWREGRWTINGRPLREETLESLEAACLAAQGARTGR